MEMLYNDSQIIRSFGHLSLSYFEVVPVKYKFEQRENAFLASNRFKDLWPVPHLHPHIELIYLLEGQGSGTADQKTEPLGPGDMFLSFSNQIHYFYVAPAKGYIFIVSPELFPDLKDIFLSKIPASPVIGRDALPCDIAARLDKIFRCANSQNRLERIAANGLMQALLAELLGLTELSDVNVNYDSVKKLLLFCSEHYRESLTLEVLAKELHLSRDYISHIFSDRLGIHFPDFINRLRVEQACQHLVKGCSMTEVAYNAGFSSIRSFNRNFKQIMGMSPSSYVRH